MSYLVTMSPRTPLGCDSFSDIPCFPWPQQFRTALVMNFILFYFLMSGLRLEGLGRKTVEAKCRYHHITSRSCRLPTRLTAFDIDLDQRWCLSVVPMYGSSFSLGIGFLKVASISTPHRRVVYFGYLLSLFDNYLSVCMSLSASNGESLHKAKYSITLYLPRC